MEVYVRREKSQDGAGDPQDVVNREKKGKIRNTVQYLFSVIVRVSIVLKRTIGDSD